MNTAQISNPSVNIKPSRKLTDYLKSIAPSNEVSAGIARLLSQNTSNSVSFSSNKVSESQCILSEDDVIFLKTLPSNTSKTLPSPVYPEGEDTVNENEKLGVQDLLWLYQYIQTQNKSSNKKVYMHELLEGSSIILPKNVEVPRNKVLEERCEKLRASQLNREYNKMTKDVNASRRRNPEDTIAYQMKQINRQLIAVFQFILSVLAGFAFGFIGVELIIGSLDFGFRLLLGIICALVIALAELYFLAKRLNEDMKFEEAVLSKNNISKLD